MATKKNDAEPATQGSEVASIVARRRAGPPAIPPITITVDDDDDNKENGEALQPRRPELTVPPKTPDLLNSTDEQKLALTPPTTSPTFNTNNSSGGSQTVFHINFGGAKINFESPFMSQGGDPRGPDKPNMPLSRLVEKQQHGPKGGEGPPARRDVPRPCRAAQNAPMTAATRDNAASVLLEIEVRNAEDPNATVALICDKSKLAAAYCSALKPHLDGVYQLVGTKKFYATYADEDVADQTRLFFRRLMTEKNSNIASVFKVDCALPQGAVRMFPTTAATP